MRHGPNRDYGSPAATGATLLPRLHVDDAAASVPAALDRPGETTAYGIHGWMRLILAAAGHDAELVRVPDDALPADLDSTRAASQHLLVSSQKARELLGFRPDDPVAAVTRSVRRHGTCCGSPSPVGTGCPGSESRSSWR